MLKDWVMLSLLPPIHGSPDGRCRSLCPAPSAIVNRHPSVCEPLLLRSSLLKNPRKRALLNAKLGWTCDQAQQGCDVGIGSSLFHLIASKMMNFDLIAKRDYILVYEAEMLLKYL